MRKRSPTKQRSGLLKGKVFDREPDYYFSLNALRESKTRLQINPITYSLSGLNTGSSLRCVNPGDNIGQPFPAFQVLVDLIVRIQFEPFLC